MIVHTSQGQTYIGEYLEEDETVFAILKPCVLNQKIVLSENQIPVLEATPVPIGFAAHSDEPILRIPFFDVVMKELASPYYAEYYTNVYSALKKIHDTITETEYQKFKEITEPQPVQKVDISGLQ